MKTLTPIFLFFVVSFCISIKGNAQHAPTRTPDIYNRVVAQDGSGDFQNVLEDERIDKKNWYDEFKK